MIDQGLDQQVFDERRRAYLGKARIGIYQLTFALDGIYEARPLDTKNVARLVKTFEMEGCSRLDPDHHVPALISRIALSNAFPRVNSSGACKENFDDIPNIVVDEPLVCLHGQHRLAAAAQFLEPEDKWWIVDLYLDDLNTTVVSALTEQYSNSRNFCDGDIYRSLRYCQLNGDKIGEGKWTARLWDTKLRDVIQLQNMAKKDPEMAKFQESLDALLPFAGLWPALQIGTFHRLLTLRCPEELSHYLSLIKDIWEHILGPAGPRLDASSVHILEGRSLLHSSEDMSYIQSCMHDRSLFPTVTTIEDRSEIWSRLSAVEYIIPSLFTFLQDTLYLEPCAKVMKKLLPTNFKGSIWQAFRKQHTGQPQIMEQRSETNFSPLSLSTAANIRVAYLQLWLFGFRHFPAMTGVQPRKDPVRNKPQRINKKREDSIIAIEENRWYEIAKLALKGGFDSTQIRQFSSQNPDEKITRTFLQQARPTDVYHFDATFLNEEVRRICRSLSEARAKENLTIMPDLSLDSQYLDQRERCGRPFKEDFKSDRKFLFHWIMYHPKWENVDANVWKSTQRRCITSFKVKRDIFRAFFGTTSPNPSFDSCAPFGELGNPILREPSLSPSAPMTSESTTLSSHSNVQPQATINPKGSCFRPHGDIPDDMLPSKLVYNFVNTNLRTEAKPILFFDIDRDHFHCIQAIADDVTSFLLSREGVTYYCADNSDKLGSVGIAEVFQKALRSRNIVFFESPALACTTSKNRSVKQLDIPKLGRGVTTIDDIRTPFLEIITTP